jgi:phosphohistidine phosphatase
MTGMRAYLVHHADAVGPGEDPLRPLSELGHRQAQQLAALARDAGCAPAAIWHSGKLRSRQTAEAFLRACNPFAEFRMVRGLRPDDPPEWMRHELAAETRNVLLVGHMPNIAALARALGAGNDPFPLHGLVVLERAETGAWRELQRFAADRQ